MKTHLNIKLTKPLTNCNVNITDHDIKYIEESLKQEVISGKGPFTTLYEEKLASYFEVEHALTCSNATLGILMVLMHLKVGKGDEVILPPTAPVMTVLPIIALNATPVFVDNDEYSFCISLTDLVNKITTNTKLIINVPMWGYANNVANIAKLCLFKGIKLLEDNSHCHGVMLNNKYLGSYGDYAVFSTHERKLITTGEGGFILVKNSNDYLKLKELRSFGEAYSISERSELFGSYGLFFGLNFKLSSVSSAIGLTQLYKLKEKITKRTINAKYLTEKILSINFFDLVINA